MGPSVVRQELGSQGVQSTLLRFLKWNRNGIKIGLVLLIIFSAKEDASFLCE